MSYKIENTFLQTGYLEEILFKTLDMYLGGEDLSDSPLVKWGRRFLARGDYWYGCGSASDQEACIRERQQKVIALYHSFKKNGYDGPPISVFFDRDGMVHTYDGFHRLCMMKYLGMKADVNVVISYHDKNPERRGDFPLARTLKKMHKGKYLYQPVDDPRLRDFRVWRKDSTVRLRYILNNLAGKTVLDIGSSEGYFSRKIAKKGYTVTALDNLRDSVAVTRYLSIVNNIKLRCQQARWQDYVKGKHFDNILYLSVFHHDVLARGVDEAFRSLRAFRGATERLFFETPVSSRKISWVSKDKKDLYSFTENEFKERIERETKMKVTDTWYGIRPLFLLKRDDNVAG